MYQYIGIDISKATLDVFDGEKSYQFPNTPSGYKDLLRHAPKGKELCFIFEPTGIYSYDLIRFCQAKKIPALIVGSKEARDYARSIKQRSKTDKIDAKVLYQYHSQIDPARRIVPRIPTPNLSARKLMQYRNVYEHHLKNIQVYRNLLESIDNKEDIVQASLHQQIDTLQQAADVLLKEIEHLLLQEEDNAVHLNHLQTINGIGHKSALMLLLEIMRYPQATAKQMTALMGLDPVLKDSGTFRGKIRISKKGGKRLRQTLYLPTLSAIRYNPDIKAFYERLVSNGKPKKVAIMAAMRKLLVLALALVRNRTTFQGRMA